MRVLLSRSAGDWTSSRWSGTPASTGVRHDPQIPCSQARVTSTPSRRSTAAIVSAGPTAYSFPLEATTTVNASPEVCTACARANCSVWTACLGHSSAAAQPTDDAIMPRGPHTYSADPGVGLGMTAWAFPRNPSPRPLKCTDTRSRHARPSR